MASSVFGLLGGDFGLKIDKFVLAQFVDVALLNLLSHNILSTINTGTSNSPKYFEN